MSSTASPPPSPGDQLAEIHGWKELRVNGRRPVLLGYQCLQAETSPAAAEHDRRVIAAFAARAGFHLRTIHTEVAGQTRSLETLLASLAAGESRTVAVASEADLDPLPRVRVLIRELIEAAGAHLLVVRDLGGVPAPRAAECRS